MSYTNDIMIKYKNIDFDEFYKIFRTILNEDVCRIIYNYSIPKFSENEKCLLIQDIYKLYDQYNRTDELEESEENIRIVGIYYRPCHSTYFYSYKTKRAFSRYATEVNLKKLKDKIKK